MNFRLTRKEKSLKPCGHPGRDFLASTGGVGRDFFANTGGVEGGGAGGGI